MERDGFEPSNPKEQIYSLSRLATSLSLQTGAENRNRTRNLLITNQLLNLVTIDYIIPQNNCLIYRNDIFYTQNIINRNPTLNIIQIS